MTFLSALYTLILSPLELLFEVVFTVANRIIGNPGLSIIFLSLAFNFLVLPLYKRADELQAEERDIQAKMAYRIKRIKSTFKGDERFMMLQEYYRINHYKPIYQLKSSVSLLLQIPFFIAAYRLLSRMQCLQGAKFGFIADLGVEDATFMIGSFPVNILPILMTLINIVSGIIYTKGHPLKSKIQVYGLAVVFLVLLYHSPSGLVFYWLLNNVFSLVKNVVNKLKNPRKVVYILSALAGAGLVAVIILKSGLDLRQKILLGIGALLLELPLILSFIKRKPSVKVYEKKNGTFFAGAVLMALITGFLIPASVINASTDEFIEVLSPSSPVLYIVNAMLLSFGSFVLWGGSFYFFMSAKMRTFFAKAIWMMCGASVINYMLFGTKLGTLSSTLQYKNAPAFALKDYLINALVVIAVCAALYFIISKFRKIALPVLLVGILTVIGIGSYNTSKIVKFYSDYEARTHASEIPSIPLSKTGKNVVVLMLDRAVGDLVPYILNEKQSLQTQFDGFTYYPNTISYATHTIFASPALFGGYEYTPERINERSDTLLSDKHDEALKLMPILFGDEGYDVTIVDPPLAGYYWNPNLNIYNDRPEFHTYLTNGQFNIVENNINVSEEASGRVIKSRNRNFFLYSLMKTAPVILQETLYNGGVYNESVNTAVRVDGTSETSALVQQQYGLSQSVGYDLDFLKNYAVLDNLKNITKITDDPQASFVLFTNDTTHSPCLLQKPDYKLSYKVDNTAYDRNLTAGYRLNSRTINMYSSDQVSHYHVNMAAFLKLGEWFDYLRENGVWDNTRIILVSDHGTAVGYYDVLCVNKEMGGFLPLLMVKDFNATGFTVCDDFMTNADTPVLATNGIIDNPVNPYTGNPINSDLKTGKEKVFLSGDYVLVNNRGKTQFSMASWYVVEGDPHKSKSWRYVGEK